jgi:hypothetical protein
MSLPSVIWLYYEIFNFRKKVNLLLYLISSTLCHEDIWGSGGIAPPFLTSALDRFNILPKFDFGDTYFVFIFICSDSLDSVLISGSLLERQLFPLMLRIHHNGGVPNSLPLDFHFITNFVLALSTAVFPVSIQSFPKCISSVLSERQQRCKLLMAIVSTVHWQRQTRPLVRELAPQGQDSNSQTESNIWSWAPDGARHQDRLTDWLTDWLSVGMWLWFWLDVTLVLGFGLRWETLSYFRSFRDHLRVLKLGVFFDDRRGSDCYRRFFGRKVK